MPSFSGVSTARNTRINTADLTSGRPADGTYPGMFVTVYTTGTQTRAVISRDNPFLVNVDGSFQFSGAASSYDLVFTDAAGATPTPAQASAPPLAWFADGATGAMPVRDEAAAEGASLVAAVASGSTWVSRGIGTSPVWQTDAEYDIRNYGGKGTGIYAGNFDNSQAFLDAADDAQTKGGGTIIVPSGMFLCDTHAAFNGTPLVFQLPSLVSLGGTGPGSVLIEGGAPTTSGGFVGLYLVGPFPYDSATTYPITAAARGDFTVTLSTHAHAGHFARGDYALLKTGSGLDGTTQNMVESANASTGVVVLRFALPKDFTSSPTIANVTALTGSHIHVRDLRIISSRQTFVGQQLFDVSFRDLTLDVCDGFTANHFQLNHVRGLTIKDSKIRWTSTSAPNGIDPGRSSSDIRILDNEIACNASAIGFSEGASHCLARGNTLFCNDGFGASAISCGAAYDVTISHNPAIYFRTVTPSVPAIFEANGGASRNVTIDHNTLIVAGTGNYAIQAGSPGTRVDHNTIESSVGGIWLTEANQSCAGNTVDLTVGGGYQGILVESALHTHTIANNRVRNRGTLGGNGIHVLDAGVQVQGPSLTGNTVVNFTGGVVIDNAGHETGIVNANNQVI